MEIEATKPRTCAPGVCDPETYPMPLRFDRELNLSAKVNEDGVVQILANVIHGK